MQLTVQGLRRLRRVLKMRSKEAKPCPDICIVLPPSYGLRPGDWFEARMINGELVIRNKEKLSAKERRHLTFGGVLTSQVKNADWSLRLLPCPFCGSRAELFPPGTKGEHNLYDVRCIGCRAHTNRSSSLPEEAVAAWNWRVQIPKAVKASKKTSSK
ncbi:MAG: Lar family restriction alleviation protein [Verrucomicrobia bacterium]|jgi:hypothetical protein|nr:Lar family restriction alleviation protein [Verrucomicrobiota bacterium]